MYQTPVTTPAAQAVYKKNIALKNKETFRRFGVGYNRTKSNQTKPNQMVTTSRSEAKMAKTSATGLSLS